MSTKAYAKAALDVVGEIGQRLPDPRDVLGVAADSCSRAGDTPAAGGRPSPRDVWYLTERRAVPDDVDFSTAAEECLRDLLTRLSKLNAAQKLKAAGLAKNASLSIYGFCHDLRDTNLCYSPEVLRMLSDLGLPLEEDFYQLAE